MTTPFLTLALLQAREAAMQFFRPTLKANGLTEQQWRIVRTLGQHGEMESCQLAERVCILKPSLTGVLNRMERDGLIQRRKADHDRRRLYFDLTAQGRARFTAMWDAVAVNHRRLQEKFDADKVAQLLALLDDLKSIRP